jgi:hypothetical protein
MLPIKWSTRPILVANGGVDADSLHELTATSPSVEKELAPSPSDDQQMTTSRWPWVVRLELACG